MNTLSITLLAGLSAPLAAQTTLLTFDASGAQGFGFALAPLGDVNGDGVPDLVVGTPNDDTAGSNAGSATVISGIDGTTLAVLHGDTSDLLGDAVTSAGDVDGDGITDYAVTSRFSDALAPNAGAVLVVSSASGNVIRALGNTSYKPFGSSVVAFSDINADGIPEIAGSTSFKGPGPERGLIEAFDGATGASLWTLEGMQTSLSAYGGQMAAVGDIDGDGIGDLIFSDRVDHGAGFQRGRVWVVSGVNGATIHEWSGTVDAENLGLDVAAAGDVDSDGTPDVLVSSNRNDAGLGSLVSTVHVYSGATGARLHTITSAPDQTLFGTTVASVGDRDGDGRPDFAVSWVGTGAGSPGRIDIFAGSDANLLARLEGNLLDDQFGRSMALLGDQDGNGTPDLAVGAPGGSNHYVSLVSLEGTFATFGLGLAGTAGTIPKLTGLGFPAVGASVEVIAQSALGNAVAYAVVGASAAALPFMTGVIHVAPPWIIVPITLNGSGTGALAFPVDAALAGVELTWQLVVVDAGAPAGFALSNALTSSTP